MGERCFARVKVLVYGQSRLLQPSIMRAGRHFEWPSSSLTITVSPSSPWGALTLPQARPRGNLRGDRGRDLERADAKPVQHAPARLPDRQKTCLSSASASSRIADWLSERRRI